MQILTIVLIIGLVQQGWLKEARENKTFVATKDWQEIQEGQGVPAGLHIRINLETGKKEAKILDENDESNGGEQMDAQLTSGKKAAAALTVVTESPGDKSGKVKTKKIKHLDEALQRIGIDYTPEEKIEKIKREYKSYEELKKSFEGMRKTFKTDAEIITQLIEDFHNSTISSSSENKDPDIRIKNHLQILESFNYLMSQFDNALLFVEQGGLEQVLLPVLVNQTNTGLKVEAMRVLGAMSQNNPRVQIKVFERNVGAHLTQILMTSTKTEELSAALYAFGCLLRKFPHAQQKILSTSGTQALVSLLSKKCELKIKVKAATIIGDIIAEKELVLSKSSETYDPLAAAQYAEIMFEYWLQDNLYCDVIYSMLMADAHKFLYGPYMLEHFINALDNTLSVCAINWQSNPQLLQYLLILQKRYSVSKDEYRLEVSQLFKNFIDKVYGKDEVLRHTSIYLKEFDEFRPDDELRHDGMLMHNEL